MTSDGRPWRKLQRLERASHRLWPVMERAIRDHLLRLPDDADGVIFESTKDPVSDLLLALNAHQEERKAVAKAIQFLLDDGYLVHRSGCLSIRNFGKEQSDDVEKKRSDSAERKRRQRERERAEKVQEEDAGHVTCHATVTRQVTDPVTVTSRDIKSRVEKRRLPVTRDCDRVTRNTDEVSQQQPASGSKVQCPRDLKLLDDQIATMETSMIPRWAIDELTQRFVLKAMADPTDKRPLSAWRKCLTSAVHGDWGDSSKRPKKPQQQVSAQPEGWVSD